MKILYLKIALTFILLTASAKAFSQLSTFIRGHTTDDIYVYCFSEVSGEPMLLYLTADGNIIHKQNEQWLYTGGLTAEPAPGIMLGHTDQYFGESLDYGKIFYSIAPFVNDYTSIDLLYGGEFQGEFIIQGTDPSVYPYPMGVLYKTTDNFSSFILIADTSTGIFNGEIGLISGEIYQIPVINGHAFFSRSLDFGASFDTIPIDTTIINESNGLKFFALSRGSQLGELFLVSKDTISATEVHYAIYHSSDYGHTWELKNTKIFDSNRQLFTAGRGTCSFYIANLRTTANSTYYTLQIFYSSDCGETFTMYEHLLSPEVGLKEYEKDNGSVTISPNPAKDFIAIGYSLNKSGKVTITLYSTDGKVADAMLIEQQTPGMHSINYNCGMLSPGIYNIVIKDDDGELITGQFIVMK